MVDNGHFIAVQLRTLRLFHNKFTERGNKLGFVRNNGVHILRIPVNPVLLRMVDHIKVYIHRIDIVGTFCTDLYHLPV